MDPGRPASLKAVAPTGYAPSRRPRWGTLLLVVLLHLAALVGLVRVFAPDFTAEVIEGATSLVQADLGTADVDVLIDLFDRLRLAGATRVELSLPPG